MQLCSTNLPFPPTFGPSFDNRDENDGMELYIVIIRESARYYFTDLWRTNFCQNAIYGLEGYWWIYWCCSQRYCCGVLAKNTNPCVIWSMIIIWNVCHNPHQPRLWQIDRRVSTGGFLQGLPVLSSLAFICYQGKSASAATSTCNQLLSS